MAKEKKVSLAESWKKQEEQFKKNQDDLRKHLDDFKVKSKAVAQRFSEMTKQKRIVRIEKNLLIVIAILAIIGVFVIYVGSKFESPQDAAEKIRSLGALGPIIVVGFIILETVVAPIPGTIIAIASGYAFGPFWGTVYSYIGNVVGAILAFFIARKFGRPFVEKIVEKDKLVLWDAFFKEKGKLLMWIAYIFPVYPSDIISFIAGLSTMRAKKFITIIMICFIPNLILLNYLGASLQKTDFAHMALIISIAFAVMFIIGGIIYASLRRQMKKT
jgi:uncharacterized membrane protein YdjX (TVP38/TMEM64 family)